MLYALEMQIRTELGRIQLRDKDKASQEQIFYLLLLFKISGLRLEHLPEHKIISQLLHYMQYRKANEEVLINKHNEKNWRAFVVYLGVQLSLRREGHPILLSVQWREGEWLERLKTCFDTLEARQAVRQDITDKAGIYISYLNAWLEYLLQNFAVGSEVLVLEFCQRYYQVNAVKQLDWASQKSYELGVVPSWFAQYHDYVQAAIKRGEPPPEVFRKFCFDYQRTYAAVLGDVAPIPEEGLTPEAAWARFRGICLNRDMSSHLIVIIPGLLTQGKNNFSTTTLADLLVFLQENLGVALVQEKISLVDKVRRDLQRIFVSTWTSSEMIFCYDVPLKLSVAQTQTLSEAADDTVRQLQAKIFGTPLIELCAMGLGDEDVIEDGAESWHTQMLVRCVFSVKEDDSLISSESYINLVPLTPWARKLCEYLKKQPRFKREVGRLFSFSARSLVTPLSAESAPRPPPAASRVQFSSPQSTSKPTAPSPYSTHHLPSSPLVSRVSCVRATLFTSGVDDIAVQRRKIHAAYQAFVHKQHSPPGKGSVGVDPKEGQGDTLEVKP